MCFWRTLFGYSKSDNKGSARWSRMLFVGKADPQDSFILYNGSNLVLEKSVRRIQTDWRGHLAFYVNFKCPSYDYQSGFGGRVVPTKGSRAAISASFKQPQGAIEPSAFYDADGAAVIEREEKQEELENQQVALYDRPGIAAEEELVQVSGGGTFPNPTNDWGDDDDDAAAQPSVSGGAHPVGQDDAHLADDGTGDGIPNPSLRLDAPTTFASFWSSFNSHFSKGKSNNHGRTACSRAADLVCHLC